MQKINVFLLGKIISTQLEYTKPAKIHQDHNLLMILYVVVDAYFAFGGHPP